MTSATSKAEEIQQVLSEPGVDLWRLRELALSEGGLVNDTLRRRAWPKLIGLNIVLDTSHTPSFDNEDNTSTTARHGSFNAPRQSERFPSVSSFPEEEDEDTSRGTEGDDVSTSSDMVIVDAPSEEMVEAQKAGAPVNTTASTATTTTTYNTPPIPVRKRSSVPKLGAYFRQVRMDRSRLMLHRDDISVCSNNSNTTASASNVAGTTPRGRRSSALPILATSMDFRQIEMDVQRCTWHLLTGDQRIQRLQMEHKRNRKMARLIRRKQRRLANLINYTLVQSYPQTSPDKLRYYQGFHDVACIFMSVLGGGTARHEPSNTDIPEDMQTLACDMGLDLPARVLVKVAQFHLRDFMKQDFKELQTAIELTLFPLMAKLDREVHDFLRGADMQPFFALSHVITWMSHEVRDTDLVKRLFDVFLVSHPLFPLYISAAMCLHPVNRRAVLSVDQDFGTVHQTLRNLTKNSSMTGWKYRPGDGYVSDDEEGDEEGDDGENALEQAGIAGDIERIKSELQEGHKHEGASGTQSSVSTCAESFSDGHVRVPFQELIDLALEFMNRVPPRKLLPLAVRYYGGTHVAALLAHSPNIRLFSDPASWAVRSRATADWVLHQRAQTKGSPAPEAELEDTEPLKEVLLQRRKSPAVVALGFGEGDDKIRKRKRRRRFVAAAVGVALVAIAVGVALQNRGSFEDTAGDQTSGERSGGVCIDSSASSKSISSPLKPSVGIETETMVPKPSPRSAPAHAKQDQLRLSTQKEDSPSVAGVMNQNIVFPLFSRNLKENPLPHAHRGTAQHMDRIESRTTEALGRSNGRGNKRLVSGNVLSRHVTEKAVVVWARVASFGRLLLDMANGLRKQLAMKMRPGLERALLLVYNPDFVFDVDAVEQEFGERVFGHAEKGAKIVARPVLHIMSGVLHAYSETKQCMKSEQGLARCLDKDVKWSN